MNFRSEDSLRAQRSLESALKPKDDRELQQLLAEHPDLSGTVYNGKVLVHVAGEMI